MTEYPNPNEARMTNDEARSPSFRVRVSGFGLLFGFGWFGFRHFLAALLLIGAVLPQSCLGAASIWLVHSSRSGGHRAAANALAAALREQPGVEPRVVCTLEHMHAVSRAVYNRGHAGLLGLGVRVRRRSFEHAFAGRAGTVRAARRGLAVKAYFSRALLREVRRAPPVLILSTDSQSNVMLSIWQRKGLLSAPIHCLVTDYDAHAIWVTPEIERYYVATQHVKAALVRHGAQPDRIQVTGIATAPAFARAPHTAAPAARRALGLAPDRPAIMMTCGSHGYGPYEQVVHALEYELGSRAPDGKQPLLFLALTGRNERLRRRLLRLAPSLRCVQLHVYGWVDGMHRYMDAADIVITKPGGLTVTELLCRQRPMLFVKPANGIERHAAAAVVTLGVADVAETPQAAARRVLGVLADPNGLQARQQASRAAARPNAVFAIAEALAERARTAGVQ